MAPCPYLTTFYRSVFVRPRGAVGPALSAASSRPKNNFPYFPILPLLSRTVSGPSDLSYATVSHRINMHQWGERTLPIAYIVESERRPVSPPSSASNCSDLDFCFYPAISSSFSDMFRQPKDNTFFILLARTLSFA